MLTLKIKDISRDLRSNWFYFVVVFLVLVLGKSFLAEGFNVTGILRRVTHDAPVALLLFFIGLGIRFVWRGWVRWSAE